MLAQTSSANRARGTVAAVPRPFTPRQSAGGGTLMVAIRSKHLETLEAVIATALNIVRTRLLADLYVRRDYTGEFRIRVQLEGRQRYVIIIKEE
jgi:hypothetical protein